MNKVYYFQVKNGEYGGIYIAANTWKEARNIAITKEIINENVDCNVITETKGHLCRKFGTKEPITTEISGELDVQQICDFGLEWWECEECGGHDFEIFDCEQSFRCRECGFVDNVPYPN